MITLQVTLTFDADDIANAKDWWKRNGFSSDTEEEHILIQAALNDACSPSYERIERV